VIRHSAFSIQHSTFLAILFLALAAACGKSEPPAKQTPTPTPAPIAESSNLLGFAKGAVVTDRTGEMALSSSPVYAIDPNERSSWITPPKDPDHTVTIALPVRARVEKIGVSTGQVPGGARPPKQMLFEGSADGSTFTRLATIDASERKNDQMFAITPVELTHVRATIVDGTTGIVAVGSLLATGSELAPYRRPSIAGTWEMNGLTARFAQSGARVWGEIGTTPPTRVEGGWSGRVIRYVSLRGKEFGYGTIVVSPDGRALNARAWYEEVIPLFEAVPYFGKRTGEGPLAPSLAVTEQWLARFSRVPLYGIEFDPAGNVDVEASAETLAWIAAQKNITTLLKREYSRDTPEHNLELSRRQIESLRSALAARGADISRVRFEPVGSTGHKESPATAVEKPLFSRVEAIAE
jgi:hypothetical protein